MTVKQINFESKEYFQTLGLRYDVLRRPLLIYFDINDLKQEGNDIHVVAFFESQIVGCLILSVISDRPFTYKMRQVAVHTDFQRKGVGKLMVEFCEKLAFQNGMNSIELHARENAVAFYLSLHYIIVGNQFLEVNIPHYKMTKELNF
jgi:ribosomal protein S18 acetylase RimI-like enzyme